MGKISTPELERLEVFLGTWNLEGQQYEGPFGPAAKITAVETYEWLPGGFFLVHRFDARIGGQPIACIEVIGHDASSQSYPTRTFCSDGNTNEWQFRERDGVWTSAEAAPMARNPMQARSTSVFSDAGNTMTAKWEYSSDGAAWQTFWDVKATKAWRARRES